MMKRELHMADIYPKVVKSHTDETITLRILDDTYSLEEGKEYTIEVLPLTESTEGTQEQIFKHTVSAVNNQISFCYGFGAEQEYYIRLIKGDGSLHIQMSVYALDEDLHGTYVFRGDLHSHSYFSDGQESPRFIAAEYRKCGFDFMGITDHSVMEASFDLVSFYKDLPVDICIFPGEEVHLDRNHIHIVNFGGDISVNKLFRDNPEKYRKEVDALAATLACPDGVNAFEYAACLWIYEKIRLGGGLGIFAHPHWLQNVYHVRDAMSWHQMRNRAFDAFEVLGGQSSEENNMQIAFYNQARAEGLNIPIVGSSDSHSVLFEYWFNEAQTLVFAENNSRDTLFDRIKNGYSVAVEAYHGEKPKVHGPYRFVSYALFLLREYFPLHDQLCAAEGQAMHEYLRSRPGSKRRERALAVLKLMQGQIRELNEEYFGA